MVNVRVRLGETQPTLLQNNTLRNIWGMLRVEYNEINLAIRSEVKECNTAGRTQKAQHFSLR